MKIMALKQYGKTLLIGGIIIMLAFPVFAKPYVYYTSHDALIIHHAESGEFIQQIDNDMFGSRFQEYFFESLDGQHVYTGNNYPGLLKINLDTAEVALLDITTGMSHATKSPVDDYLYSTLPNSVTPAHELLAKIDLQTGQLVASYALEDPGFRPNFITVSPDGDKLYVLIRNSSIRKIRVFDTATLTPIIDINIPRRNSVNTEMLATSSGNHLYFLSFISDGTNTPALGILDTTNNSLEFNPIAGIEGELHRIDSVKLSVDGSLFLMLDSSYDYVQIVDTQSFELAAVIKLPEEVEQSWYGVDYRSFDVNPFDQNLYVYGFDYGIVTEPVFRLRSTIKTAKIDLTTLLADESTTLIHESVEAPLHSGIISFGEMPLEVQISSEGVTANQVRCTNNTTGQFVNIVAQPNENSWHCTDYGLLVSPGDDVKMSVRGIVQ